MPIFCASAERLGIVGNILSINGHRAFFFASIFMVKNTGSSKAEGGLPGTGRAGDHDAPALGKERERLFRAFCTVWG